MICFINGGKIIRMMKLERLMMKNVASAIIKKSMDAAIFYQPDSGVSADQRIVSITRSRDENESKYYERNYQIIDYV